MKNNSSLIKIRLDNHSADIAPLILGISVVQDERHAFRLGTLQINGSAQAGVEF